MSVCRIGFKAMGSPCEIVLDGLAEPTAESWAQQAITEVLRIERKYSRYRTDSLIARINASAGGDPVPIDPETYSLLAYAHSMYEQSRGAFDITAGVLRRAWNFQSGSLPAPDAVEPLLAHVGWSCVEVSQTHLRLPRAGMEIDLGGFGKEYAVDRAAACLKALGVAHGYVNLAGDMRFLGPKASGDPWMIGIQHPRLQNQMLAHVPMAEGALATSGDYERAIWVEGKPYSHILNAKTGWPVSSWQMVSVLAPLALMAGTVSTVAMLLEEQGLAFLQQNPFNFLAVDAHGQLHRPEASPQATRSP